ncbi:MAG: GNAT family N-acetyltransferase [Clostridia bacterium]
MIKLPPEHYEKVTPLLHTVPFNTLFARAVIEKKADGHVFVDDQRSLTVCFIIHKYGMALLCGNHGNDVFNDKLVRFLKNSSFEEYPAKWMLTFPNEWEHILASLLGTALGQAGDANDSPFLQTVRINYHFQPRSHLNIPALPDGFSLVQIDFELYHRIQGSVVPQQFWNHAEDFLAHGVGFSLIYEEQIVSTAFAAYLVADQLELGIETTEAFRKKGYAIYPAAALIQYCLAHGYEPLWACRRENIGSSRLAERLGFVPSSYHPYYGLPSRF